MNRKPAEDYFTIEPRGEQDFKEMFTTDGPDRFMTPVFENVTAKNIYFKTQEYAIPLEARAKLAEKPTNKEGVSAATLNGMNKVKHWADDGLFDIPFIGDHELKIIEGKFEEGTLTIPADAYEDILDTFPEDVPSSSGGGSYNPFGRFASDVAIGVYLIVGDAEKEEEFKETMKKTIDFNSTWHAARGRTPDLQLRLFLVGCAVAAYILSTFVALLPFSINFFCIRGFPFQHYTCFGSVHTANRRVALLYDSLVLVNKKKVSNSKTSSSYTQTYLSTAEFTKRVYGFADPSFKWPRTAASMPQATLPFTTSPHTSPHRTELLPEHGHHRTL